GAPVLAGAPSVGCLLGEEPAGLQLEERGDEDEELAAGLEVELVPLEEVLDEGEDDPRHVDLSQIQLVLQDERQQPVERPFERVEVELELPDDHGSNRSRATGRGHAGRSSSGLSAPPAPCVASPWAPWAPTACAGTATRRRTRRSRRSTRARPRS